VGTLQAPCHQHHIRQSCNKCRPLKYKSKRWKALLPQRKKPRRQQPFGGYILDFVCLEAKLVIEIDGGQHAGQIDYDEQRTRYLETAGFTVLRFWNNEVLQQTHAVLTAILHKLEELKAK